MIETINKQHVEKVVLLTIFLEIIAPIFSALPISGSIIVPIRALVSIIAFFIILVNSKKFLFTSPLVFYLLWTLYVYFKNLITGMHSWGSPIQMYTGFVTSSICLFSCVYAFQKNERATMNVIIVALYVFCIISLFVGKSGTDSEEGRLGSEMLNSNAIGVRGALIVFFVIIKYLKKQITLIQLFLLLVFPVIIVILTGSRTGFGMTIFYLSIFIFGKKSSNLSIVWRIILIAIAVTAYFWITKNTMIGERLVGTSTQIEGSIIETGTFWDLFGDRGYQYYIGIPLIKEFFWFGMGSGNFKFALPGYEHVLHSEYLIQLLECGIIATILYFAVYLWIIKNTLSIKSNIIEDVTFKRYFLLSMLALLFACLVTRISYYGAFSCCIAYMIYYLKNHQLIEK